MASKLPGRPNLALAGKREAPGATKTGGDPKRGRGGGRGGRGRGGRGGASDRGGFQNKKPELIQTGGVFSEGLGGDFPTRKKEEKSAEVQQFTVKKIDTTPREKRKDENGEKVEKGEKEKKKVRTPGKTSFEGWDELWKSDDDEDEQHLKRLLPRGIISDYKRGTILPYVLPNEDKPQFLKVLNKTARDALQEEENEMEEDKKTIKRENLTASRLGQKTAQELVSMIEASTSELLHLQLPSVIGSLCHQLEQADPVNEKMEVDDMESNGQNGQSEVVSGDKTLPTGRRIGKLQVTRKGRLLLQIGGYSINITSKSTTGKQQGTVLLETEPTIDPMMSPPGISRAPEAENAVYFIGNVKHNLVGSMAWGDLNKFEKTGNRKKNREGEQEVVENDVTMVDESHAEEIRKLEEVQSSWKNQAEQWASGKLI